MSEWVTEGVFRTDHAREIEAKVLLTGVPQGLALPRDRKAAKYRWRVEKAEGQGRAIGRFA